MNNFETDYNDPDYCDEGTPGICFDMRVLRAELMAAEARVAELERELAEVKAAYTEYANNVTTAEQRRIAELEQERDEQKRIRIKYQDLVYQVCGMFDSGPFGGTGTVTVGELVDTVRNTLTSLRISKALLQDELASERDQKFAAAAVLVECKQELSEAKSAFANMADAATASGIEIGELRSERDRLKESLVVYRNDLDNAVSAHVAEENALRRERDRLNRIAGIAAKISTYRTLGDVTGARVPLRLLEALDRAIAQAAKKGGAT